jgi:hypothetical protein
MPNENGPGALAGATRGRDTNSEQELGPHTTPVRAAPAWRSRLSVHPAAELFPILDGDELKALAADIKKQGIRQPIAVMKDGDGWQVIDGRNRLTAAEMAGINGQSGTIEPDNRRDG